MADIWGSEQAAQGAILAKMKLKQTNWLEAGELREIPNVINTIETLGENSIRFVPLKTMYDQAVLQMPTPASEDLLTICSRNASNEAKGRDMAHRIKDFFRGVKVEKPLGPETLWLPVTELHRPQVPGCTASIAATKTQASGYDFEVKVMGVGVKLDMARSFVVTQEASIDGPCSEVAVPVTVEWEQCRNAAGEQFNRARLTNIGDGQDVHPIPDEQDRCRVASDQIQLLGWALQEYRLGTGATSKPSIQIEAGQAKEVSLQPKLFGAEFGLKASVKSLRTVQFQYALWAPKSTMHISQGANSPGTGTGTKQREVDALENVKSARHARPTPRIGLAFAKNLARSTGQRYHRALCCGKAGGKQCKVPCHALTQFPPSAKNSMIASSNAPSACTGGSAATPN